MWDINMCVECVWGHRSGTCMGSGGVNMCKLEGAGLICVSWRGQG